MQKQTFPVDLLGMVAGWLQADHCLHSLACLSQVCRQAYCTTVPYLYHTFTISAQHMTPHLSHFKAGNYKQFPTNLDPYELGCHTPADSQQFDVGLQKEMQGIGMVENGHKHPMSILGSARVLWLLKHMRSLIIEGFPPAESVTGFKAFTRLIKDSKMQLGIKIEKVVIQSSAILQLQEEEFAKPAATNEVGHRGLIDLGLLGAFANTISPSQVCFHFPFTPYLPQRRIFTQPINGLVMSALWEYEKDLRWFLMQLPPLQKVNCWNVVWNQNIPAYEGADHTIHFRRYPFAWPNTEQASDTSSHTSSDLPPLNGADRMVQMLDTIYDGIGDTVEVHATWRFVDHSAMLPTCPLWNGHTVGQLIEQAMRMELEDMGHPRFQDMRRLNMKELQGRIRFQPGGQEDVVCMVCGSHV